MDVWAQQYFGRATFICVGCDGPELARAFAMRLQLSKCMMTYVDRANSPKWGQLGCNGFILIDASGKVACRATSAYLDVQELAFAHVESLLEPLLSAADQPPSAPPTNCESADKRGESVEPFDRVTGGCPPPQEMPERMKRALASADAGKEGAPESTKRPTAATTTAAPPSKVADVAPLAAIDSVKVAALDAEHDACATALAAMAEAPNRENIEKVVEAYTAHFAHEEALLDEHLYTAAATSAEAGGGFSAEASARRSHFADHQRMLGDLRARAAGLPAGGPTTGPKAWIHTTTGGETAAAFVDRVLRAFEHHANVYDAAYAEPLAERLGEAAGPVSVH